VARARRQALDKHALVSLPSAAFVTRGLGSPQAPSLPNWGAHKALQSLSARSNRATSSTYAMSYA
jgi:hypothetical protein